MKLLAQMLRVWLVDKVDCTLSYCGAHLSSMYNGCNHGSYSRCWVRMQPIHMHEPSMDACIV